MENRRYYWSGQQPKPNWSGQRLNRSNRLSDRIQHLKNCLDKTGRHLRGCTVLDLGCGGGQITEELMRVFHPDKVYGADISMEGYQDQRLSKANDPICLPPNNFLDKGEAYSYDNHVVYLKVGGENTINSNLIDLPNQSIDLITCFMVIHHFDNFDMMINEIQRLLKPNGLFFYREHDVDPQTHIGQTLRNQLNQMHRHFPDQPGSRPIQYWSRNALKLRLGGKNTVPFGSSQIISQPSSPTLITGWQHLCDSDYPPSINNRQAIYHSLWQWIR